MKKVLLKVTFPLFILSPFNNNYEIVQFNIVIFDICMHILKRASNIC